MKHHPRGCEVLFAITLADDGADDGDDDAAAALAPVAVVYSSFLLDGILSIDASPSELAATIPFQKVP